MSNIVIATLSAALVSADKKIKMFSERLEACKPEAEAVKKVFDDGTKAIEALGDALPNGKEIASMLGSGYAADTAALKLKVKKLETNIADLSAEKVKLTEELAKHQPAPTPVVLEARCFQGCASRKNTCAALSISSPIAS